MYVFKSRSKGEQEAFQLRIEYEVGGRVQCQVEGDKEESYRIRREVPTVGEKESTPLRGPRTNWCQSDGEGGVLDE